MSSFIKKNNVFLNTIKTEAVKCTGTGHPHLPLVELLGGRGPQAHQVVVFSNGSRAFPGRCEPLHLRH